MNTNWTGFRPINVMRVLNINTAITAGTPLAITNDVAWIMDSTLSPRTLPDGSAQGQRLQVPVVEDVRSNFADYNYVGIARDDIPVATAIDASATYAQDGIGDCILEGVCYVEVTVPEDGTSIAVGDPLFFDDASAPTMITSYANITDATHNPRQVGIALGAVTMSANADVTQLVLAFIDQFPRSYTHPT